MDLASFKMSTVVALALAAALLFAGVALSPTPRVSAGPSSAASCIGLEFAAISPPGTSDEFPGGAPEAVHGVQSFARELGLPPGTIVSFIAGLHEGSHEACDEATE